MTIILFILMLFSIFEFITTLFCLIYFIVQSLKGKITFCEIYVNLHFFRYNIILLDLLVLE